MIGLFVSAGCYSCRKIIEDMPENWRDQITILNVKFDINKKCYWVYKDGKRVGEKAPVNAIPTMYFSDTEEVYSGYKDIMNRLTNE